MRKRTKKLLKACGILVNSAGYFFITIVLEVIKMSEIKIMCAYGKLVDPDELIENPKNPNQHPEKQIEILAKLIKSQGFRRPIVVSKRSGFVVVGHGRLMAAKYLKMKEVPVDYQDYESEAKEWADMVADNKVAEFAEFDNSVLSDMLQDLDDFDEELFGMAQDDIDKIMGRVERAVQQNNTHEIDIGKFDDEKFEHTCPRCGFKF